MNVGVEPVRELRERTGAGIMDCKVALQQSAGDMEKAVDFLRKKGVASSAKRAGRQAKEGLIGVQISGADAVLVEANCETDFVARTEDFKGLLQLAIQETLSKGEEALSSDKIAQRVAELSGKIGEKILVSRAKKSMLCRVFFSAMFIPIKNWALSSSWFLLKWSPGKMLRFRSWVAISPCRWRHPILCV
jgi:elongation factor Ts